MKILLDENAPTELKVLLRDHYVSHVKDEGWLSVTNGELLNLMIASGFEALITRDGSLQYQQNLRRYSIPVIVLRTKDVNKQILERFAVDINKLLKGRLHSRAYELILNP